MYFRADTAFVLISLVRRKKKKKKLFPHTPGILIRNSNLTTVLLFRKTNKNIRRILLVKKENSLRDFAGFCSGTLYMEYKANGLLG